MTAASNSAFRKCLVEAVKDVVAEHGIQAFEETRQSAALHEAGHAVICTIDGDCVTHVEVEQIVLFGRQTWGGHIIHGNSDGLTPTTLPSQDWRTIRRILSGIAAEVCFVGNDATKPGSSLDERVCGSMLLFTLAEKIGADFERLSVTLWKMLDDDLRANEMQVRRIAKALEHDPVLQNPRLQELLKGVRRASPMPPTGEAR